MAKKQAAGEVNKSQAIRDLLKENPKIKGKEAVAKLAANGIEVKNSLFYLVKGKISGGKTRRRKVQSNAVAVAVASPAHPTPADALATIRKVQALASDVGGLRTLKQLVDALSE